MFLNLDNLHRMREILLVGKHQQQGILQLAGRQDPMELGARLVYPVAVLAVNDKDERLGAGVVMAPQRSNLILTTNIL